MESNNNFLHNKLPDLQKSDIVQESVNKYTRITGRKVANNPEERLAIYMGRLEKIFLNDDEKTRQRNIQLLRKEIYNAFIIRRDQVPESYFELQKRVARERGQEVIEISDDFRNKMIDVIIEDQKKSLDEWMDYLSSDDAAYPTWFKYFVFRNIIKLSQFDKELGKFKQRTSTTTAPFPEINREALAIISDTYEGVDRDKNLLEDPDFQVFLSKKFPVQYAEAIQKTLESFGGDREQINGEWVRYQQGDDDSIAKQLYSSLKGRGTGWCTAGFSTAKEQLKSGDFLVYYTYDGAGVPNNPRLAIRMNGKEKIAEVRGVLPHQEVEPILQDVLDKKLMEFGNEAGVYRKKSLDMKRLTELDNKNERGEALTKEDLFFLYEVNETIEGFGYRKDSRISKLIFHRNNQDKNKNAEQVKKDIEIMFEGKATDNFLDLSDEKPVYYEIRGYYDELQRYDNNGGEVERFFSIDVSKDKRKFELFKKIIKIIKEVQEKYPTFNVSPNLFFKGGITSLQLETSKKEALFFSLNSISNYNQRAYFQRKINSLGYRAVRYKEIESLQKIPHEESVSAFLGDYFLAVDGRLVSIKYDPNNNPNEWSSFYSGEIGSLELIFVEDDHIPELNIQEAVSVFGNDDQHKQQDAFSLLERINQSKSIARVDFFKNGGVLDIDDQDTRHLESFIKKTTHMEGIKELSFQDNWSRLKAYILRYDQTLSSGGIIADMEKLNLRPCTFSEAVRIFSKNPSISEDDYVLVALGTKEVVSSNPEKDNEVVCFSEERMIMLKWDKKWVSESYSKHFRFLAVDREVRE